ncbi:MAG: GNAT family N-acetyltransferase [Anaerolineales bacterium]|nr:GNAT family N-acetyltransferase [Anaerolineales bacterium]MCA9927468.1 GNAT family N-acetyltransferase [Anaerolineales bacterium]
MRDEKLKPGWDAVVTLREVTKETVRPILKLEVAPEQKGFVAPNAVSIAQAYFEEKAWFRAIYADETPVGFVMLYDDAEKPEYFLWRYMIDAKYQGRGYGRSALNLLIDYVKTRPGAKELLVSYVPAEGGPEKFYAKLGFVNTGVEHDGEMEMKLTL